MNNERTIVLENVSTSTIGLSDTQGRMYRVGRGGKVRISPVILQDILDHQGSKVIFKEGMAKVSNITRKELLAMGLTEAEVNLFIKDELKEEEVIEEPKEELAVEEISTEPEIEEEPIIEEPKEEIIKEEPIIEEKPKKTVAKKTTKKSTSKKRK